MPERGSAPPGAPCWTDLWTSDVQGSRRFYSELFGWEAQEPNEGFGGYFMFTREGVPVAGGMGAMGDLPPSDSWKIYLATPDVTRTLVTAEAEGAEITSPPIPVADLGTQAVFVDPTGAIVGAWQAGTFPGFTVVEEHGAPSWFELYTRDHSGAVAFYRSVFGFEMTAMADSDEFRYTTARNPGGKVELAGIMDARDSLGAGTPSHWITYWEVDDVDVAVHRVTSLGGSLSATPKDTPFGRMATVADPVGASFVLRTGDRLGS